MAKITDFDQELQSFEWIAADELGALAYFATGASGAMPASVTLSREDLYATVDAAQALPVRCKPIVEPNACSRVHLRDDIPEAEAQKQFLEHFVAMSARGLYAYYVAFSGGRPDPYWRVAKPAVPLYLGGLPESLSSVVGRTRLALRFEDATEVPVSAITGSR